TVSEWAATSDQVKLLMAGSAGARDFAVWTPSVAVALMVGDPARAAPAGSDKLFASTPAVRSGLRRQITIKPLRNLQHSMNGATNARLDRPSRSSHPCTVRGSNMTDRNCLQSSTPAAGPQRSDFAHARRSAAYLLVAASIVALAASTPSAAAPEPEISA